MLNVFVKYYKSITSETIAKMWTVLKWCSEFANGIAEKLTEMLQSSHVPVETKTAVLPVLAHVHYDACVTQKVFEYT